MTENPPGLVIDAYNLLSVMAKEGKEAARKLCRIRNSALIDMQRFRGKELIEQRALMEEDILTFSQRRGYRTCIVYDAIGNRNPGKAPEPSF